MQIPIVVGLLVVNFLPRAAVVGQETRCTANRAGPTVYRGECLREGTRVASVSLRPVAGRRAGLYQGSFLRAADSLPIAVDTRPSGALQLGRAWLKLFDPAADSTTVRFGFREDGPASANHVDLDILRRARRYLDEPARWNRADTTDMAAAPTKGFSCAPAPRQSLFCALYLASLDVVGDYAHFRPAVNAIRDAVAQFSKNPYRHPLVEFTNDPGNDIHAVWRVVDRAIELVDAQQAKR